MSYNSRKIYLYTTLSTEGDVYYPVNLGTTSINRFYIDGYLRYNDRIKMALLLYKPERLVRVY